MKVRLVIQRSYGNIEIEGNDFDEIVEELKRFPEWLALIDNMVTIQTSTLSEKEALAGLVQITADGPLITIPREKLTAREAVGLLLYATEPKGLGAREISQLLNLSGFLSVGFASRLSELKREGFAYKEGEIYRLTVSGKKWIEELVSSLKSGGATVE
ncbi:MAG: hypothetical protein QW265_04705 [Candidatus Bathyarchaeia archaeon]